MSYQRHNFEDGKTLYAQALNEMEDQILLNSGSPVWSFTSEYETELNNVIEAVKEIQDDDSLYTVEFIMFSDIHRTNVNDHPEFYRMMDAINYLTHELDIKFVASLGDNYNGYPTEGSTYGKGAEGVFEEMVNVLSDLNAPFININGNHDSVPHIYKRNWITNLSNAVFDTIGSWFYFDDDFHKIRFIVLDCQDWDGDALEWTTVTSINGYADRSYEQLNWLANIALKTTNKIIFLQHQSMEETGYYLVHPTKPTSDGRYYFTTNIIDGFEQGTSGSVSYDSDRTINFDFSNQGEGIVLCNFSGHTHGDAYYNASYSYPSGFTSTINEIAIDDALYSTGTHAGKHNAKTLNTVNEIAFDVVSIDILNNIIRCYRFGAGQNRICTLNGTMFYEDFPEIVEPEEEIDGTDITSLFTWTDAAGINATTGTVDTTSEWMYSDYVDVSGYSQLQITTIWSITTSTTTKGLAFYDSNKTYISGVTNNTKATTMTYEARTIDIPDSAVYIRASWASTNNSAYNDNLVISNFKCIAAE